MTPPLLEIRDLQVTYGRLTAVQDLSLTVYGGEIVSLLGPNGAGKSTTLLAVAGAVPVKRGVIVLDGVPITGLAPEDIVARGLSLVPEGRHIFSRLTVRENLLIGTFSRANKGAVDDDIERVMELFPVIRNRLSSPAGRLSGGEQQQLAIARAMMTRPRLLLVDEPSLGLAPLVVEHVYAILAALRDGGVTLVVVEQSVERAMRAADRLFVLRDGAIRMGGNKAELGARQHLEDAYFGSTRA